MRAHGAPTGVSNRWFLTRTTPWPWHHLPPRSAWQPASDSFPSFSSCIQGVSECPCVSPGTYPEVTFSLG